MLTRRIYDDSPEAAELERMDGNGFYRFDGALWRYEHTSSDSRGKFRLFVRSPDEAGAPTHGYCGAFGKPGEG